MKYSIDSKNKSRIDLFDKNKLKHFLINIAINSIETELLCYPSLGLVSFRDSGCHLDMNIKTFLSSKDTFYDYFEEISDLCINSKELNFNKLRQLGIKQEKRMFCATNNINTHKGLIFSFGIVFYITFYSLINNIDFSCWSDKIKKFTKPLENDFLFFKNKTKGEQIFQKYGILGARGEALSGYHNIFVKGLPFLKKCCDKYPNLKKNELYLCLLIFYLKEINDTTLISKIGYKKNQEIKENFRKLIDVLENINFELFLKKIIKHNDFYKKENISPGGCADLSVITLFLFYFYNSKK
ncbi:triphosphoribosyl-dephospho-CoA synthase [Columbia Basin potato purple top phytoplasma]|uniref:triphosphoribosyl-dephospho-CoA synthase n=1 Tax=Columbia Basin potato purple top phytoplasma TaxID=307134 RepID=A0ABT5L826_9MOLU|nr:triphosphoribosyl-dephospho-CoA synthase [Columbia Basin potato purple top phytoplasma]MDC9031839.1 triphosphoribosyl-dephospho-CoA synthase [Columbia Basin potato purple top phytoplasma]